MNIITTAVLLLFYLINVCAAGDQATPSAEQDSGCITSQCHSTMSIEKNVHLPKISCKDCHQSATPQHPLEGQKTFSFPHESTCFSCHKVLEQRYLHPPAANGDCLSCHVIHDNKGMRNLKEIGATLCVHCHKQFEGNNADKGHISADEKGCLACHTPHGSQYDNLLVKEYSSAIYVNYSEKEYQLCFACHKRNLLQFPDTQHYTEFRDGKKNLHYLHVTKDHKGINCKLCHEIHSSDKPKLIAEQVRYGSWQLPLNFNKTETGGSCYPGCHKATNYDRLKP